jgi:LysM repeat protein
MDHSNFLRNSPRYSFLFQLDPTDYEGWAFGLKKAGYATNNKYSQILINLIRTYKLQDYTLIALGKMKESDRMLASDKVIGTITPTGELSEAESLPGPSASPTYPVGQFTINNTKVVYVMAKTAWLSLAEQYGIPLTRLWDFNDLESDDDLLPKAQLVYIQRKRKVGSNEFHIMKSGENLYDVCQTEGIRYESLLELNHLNGNRQPAPGEKLYLQYAATAAPLLETDQKNKQAFDKKPEKPAFQAASYLAPGSQANNNNVDSATEPPESTTHLVSSNETLYSISKKYGVELEKIMKWNRLDSMNVKIGQSLIIYRNN